MLADEKDYLLRQIGLELQPGAYFLGDSDPFFGMPASQALADIVEQQTQMQHGRVFDFMIEIAITLESFTARVGQIVERLDGAQCVLVNRITMIEVMLNQTGDPPELRHELPQKVELVHHAQPGSHPPLRPEHLQ